MLTVNDPVSLDTIPDDEQGQASGVSATAEQGFGALGIAVLYALFHGAYVKRLHEIVDTGPLQDLTTQQYEALRAGLLAAESTGLRPSHFDPSLVQYLFPAKAASEHGYAIAFIAVSVVAAIGLAAVTLLVRSRRPRPRPGRRSPARRHAIHGEPRAQAVRRDGADAPAAVGVQRRPQLVLTERMGSVRTRAHVAEAEDVQAAAGTDHRREARDVLASLLAIERVEQRAVEHRVELPAECLEAQRIGDEELGVRAAIGSSRSRDRHRGRRNVEPEHVEAERRDVQRVVAGSAARIEHRAGERALARQPHDRGLWLSDVPRCRAIGVGGIP